MSSWRLCCACLAGDCACLAGDCTVSIAGDCAVCVSALRDDSSKHSEAIYMVYRVAWGSCMST